MPVSMTVAQLKERLGLPCAVTSTDGKLLASLEAVEAAWLRATGRKFFFSGETDKTLYIDGIGRNLLLLPRPVVEVSGVAVLIVIPFTILGQVLADKGMGYPGIDPYADEHAWARDVHKAADADRRPARRHGRRGGGRGGSDHRHRRRPDDGRRHRHGRRGRWRQRGW